MSEEHHILLLGPPASGKGTQARRVADALGLSCLGTGKLLRDEVKQGTKIGLEVETHLSAGNYVPDALVLDMVNQWVKAHQGGWVFDGFPRTIPQAEALTTLCPPNLVIALDVDKAELERRITSRRECGSCGETISIAADAAPRCPLCGSDDLRSRSDDKLESFQNRYKVYQELTEPLFAFYKAKGQLISVDGTGTPDEVFSAVMHVIETARVSC